MRFWKSAVALFAVAQILPSSSFAQLNSKIGSNVTDTARQSTSGATRMNLAAPKVASVNPQRIYPASEVVIAGTDIMNATEVQIKVGCIVASDGSVSCGNPSATVTAPLRDATSIGAKFTMPEVPGVGDGAPIVLQLAAGRNVGTFASGLALDARPVITAVRNPSLSVGQTLFIDGRNLQRAKSARIGSVSMPVTVLPGGSTVTVLMASYCEPNGALVLEETPGPATWPSTSLTASPSYVASSIGTVNVACSGGVNVVSVTPTAGKAGTVINVLGTGFNAITDVSYGTASFQWSRQSDQQITLKMPDLGDWPTSGSRGVAGYIKTAGGTLVLPALSQLLPPKINEIGPSKLINGEPAIIIDPGQQIIINGYGLSEPPLITPTLTMGNVQLPIMFMSPLQVRATMQSNAPSGPLTFTTQGGSVTSTQTIYVMSGNASVESIEPAVAAPGDVVTLNGQNLFRLWGICTGPNAFAQVINEAKTEHPYSNTSASFVVPSTWEGKAPISIRVDNGGLLVCAPTPVTLEIKR